MRVGRWGFMSPSIFIALFVITCRKSEKGHMKIAKLTVALAIAGLLGLGGMAHAVVVEPVSPDTYVFEAAPGYTTAFNGSTITIAEFPAGPWPWEPASDAVIGYDFVDTDLNPTTYSSDIVPYNTVTSYDTTGWVGEFDVDVGNGVTFDATGTSMDEYPTGSAVVGGDPPGTWTYVPDASSTFPMLLGVMAVLFGAHYCNRPRVLALARR